MSTQTLNKIESRLADLDPAIINFSETNEMFRDPSEFTPESLKDLANSIIENGLAQPILVRPTIQGGNGKYILVAGERRLRAWSLAKIQTGIPAYIRELSDEQALELQIIENLQREDLNPIKEANSFHQLVKEKKFSTAGIAAKIGKSIDYVQERMRLAGLVKPLQDLVRAGDIPLKAGLKFAMIPEKDQEDAMGDTTEVIDLGVPGKRKTIFLGLERLQEWMDNHLFIDLKTADFDKEDPNLNPEMGPCSRCVFRTKNTGGLFDDITLVDECTKASCFRTKQVNNYTRIKDDLKKRFPKAKIIFKKRSNSIEGLEVYRKHLVGEIKGAGAGKKCSEKEALNAKGSELAILIGVARGYINSFPHSEKYTWIRPQEARRMDSTGSSSKVKDVSPELAEKNAQKEKEKALKEQMVDGFETKLITEKILEWVTNDKVYAEILRQWLDDELDYSDNVYMIPALKALGLDWYMGGKLVKAKEFDVLEYWQSKEWEVMPFSGKDIERTLQQIKLNELVALVFVAKYHGDARIAKLLNINEKEVEKKANSQMQSWWAKELEKKGGKKK